MTSMRSFGQKQKLMRTSGQKGMSGVMSGTKLLLSGGTPKRGLGVGAVSASGMMPGVEAQPTQALSAGKATKLRSKLIYDQRLGDFTYTLPELNELLGQSDVLSFALYLDGRAPVALTQASLTLQHSPDGVNWLPHTAFLDYTTFTGNTAYFFNTVSFPLASGLRRLQVGITGSGAAARVRLWVTSRGPGTRRFSELVFEERFDAGVTKRSDDELGLRLGSADALHFFAIAEDVGGTSVKLTVQVEESPDGLAWSSKGSPAINLADVYAGTSNRVVGEDSGALPTAGYVRLAVTLSGTSPSATVRIYATGRGE